jgi:hypothetical protein
MCVLFLRTNSDFCPIQRKVIGFYNRDEKCLQRGTDWRSKYSGLRFVFKGLIYTRLHVSVKTIRPQALQRTFQTKHVALCILTSFNVVLGCLNVNIQIHKHLPACKVVQLKDFIIWWSPNVRSSLHKISILTLILEQINPVHIHSSHLIKINLNIILSNAPLFGPITRPEESYGLWCVVVCDLETSWMRRH